MRKAATKRAKRTPRAEPRRITLRVTLRDLEPAIWRELSLPDSFTLEQLHRCIQLTFDWLDYHLFEFHIGSRRFERADAEAEGENAAAIQLADLNFQIGSAFVYAYDMGDGWEHDVVVKAIKSVEFDEEPNGLGYVVGGARAAPPEDVGGPSGYEQLVLAVQRRSVADEDLVAWVGQGFEPELFDLRASNHALVLATAWGVI
jgi:hypothetical protein